MEHEHLVYELRCEEEWAAAEKANSVEARVAHLELALRFALLATSARPKGGEVIPLLGWSPETNVAE